MTDRPLTRPQLIEAFGFWSAAFGEEADWDALQAWSDFMAEHGGEILSLAISAVGRLGPKELRGPYGQRMLGQTQQRIVDLLSDGTPRTITQMAEGLGLNYQNTRRMLPVLEARGLIGKHHDPIKAAQVWTLPGAAAPAAQVDPPPAPEPELASPKKERLALTPEQRVQEHMETMRYIHGWDDDDQSPPPKR